MAGPLPQLTARQNIQKDQYVLGIAGGARQGQAKQPSWAWDPHMASDCGYSPCCEVGQYQVSAGSHSPGIWVLGTGRQQWRSCLPRVALPGLSVAERCRTLDLQPRGLRHTGLGVLNQSQEMDLPYQCGGDTGLAAGVNLKLLLVYTEAASLLPVMLSGPCAQTRIPPIQNLPLKQSWRCSAFPWATYPLRATPFFPSGQFSVPI